MNMFLHGRTTTASSGATPSQPKLLDGAAPRLKHFDIVVANPPFSLEKWGFEGEADKVQPLPPGLPPRTKGRLRLHPAHGRDHEARHRAMAVVVPHGVLFRGAAEGRIRQKLIEETCWTW